MTTQTSKKTRGVFLSVLHVQVPAFRVVTVPDGEVVLRYTDDSGEEVKRVFWCPADGGYVRDVTDQEGQLGRQVCKRLGINGDTLRCETRADLAALIRREHRAYLRAARQ